MERRDFIIKGCAICLGGSLLTVFLESCQPIPIYKTEPSDNTLRVPIEKFKENNYLIVRSYKLYYDVALIRSDNSNYKSFKMICTHAKNPLSYNGKEFYCNLHGSLFNAEGKVKKGPAEKQLISFDTRVENNFIVISLGS